ncbi:MAG: SDR family NAD(P)-dependent oxidoreductase, partial [Armatimonadetes bacterium]|nr:SDR family NAD(P)-dependent oxidoreductase [Armatimonadota bacterium]NIO96991.1 SDR family NAD(P)-dependent oxidoreductase [Armatimonadota bacterium]
MMDARRPGSKPTALVTGASSGIGYELARKFAGNGYDLVIVARNRQRLEDLAVLLHKDYGTNVVVLPKDLAAEPSAQEIVDYLKNEAIKIDILVNNAGFDVHGLFIDTDLERELQMIQVNLVTLTRLTKFLLPDMVEQGFGMVLNVGSIGSFVPSPLNAVYSATKAYVLSFSEAIAEELVGSGVSVTVLCPGTTRTEFQRRAGMQNVRLL